MSTSTMSTSTMKTTSIAVTDSERTLVKAASARADLSTSAWIAQLIAGAVASRATWQAALDDVAALAARKIPARERVRRVSTITSEALWTDLDRHCDQSHVVLHSVAQALAVMGAERQTHHGVVPLKGFRIDPKIPEAAEGDPPSHHLCRELQDLLGAFARNASPEKVAAQIWAAAAIRGDASTDKWDRAFARLPGRPWREHVMVVSGWLRIKPETIYRAAVIRAEAKALAQREPEAAALALALAERERQRKLASLPLPAPLPLESVEADAATIVSAWTDDDDFQPPLFLRKDYEPRR